MSSSYFKPKIALSILYLLSIVAVMVVYELQNTGSSTESNKKDIHAFVCLALAFIIFLALAVVNILFAKFLKEKQYFESKAMKKNMWMQITLAFVAIISLVCLITLIGFTTEEMLKTDTIFSLILVCIAIYLILFCVQFQNNANILFNSIYLTVIILSTILLGVEAALTNRACCMHVCICN